MAQQRIVVDPVTRIEGHLRIEAELDAGGTITEAYSSGTMVRGIERILRGRDPREAWVFAQRACGVCTAVHGIASVRAVEDALGIQIPRAATLARNLMIAQQYAHDHVLHFYHLHALDWVDVTSALDADPAATADLQRSLSDWPVTEAGLADVQDRVRSIVESGELSIFAGGPWGHPAYKLPPNVNLLAVAHYLEALDWQADAVRIHVVLGGKNPHPNFVVGGMPLPIDMASPDALNADRLAVLRDTISSITRFVDQVYLPDVLAIAAHYPEYAALGEGLGNFMTWGEFPTGDGTGRLVPGAVILGRDLANLATPDPRDLAGVKEYVARSWYAYGAGDEAGLHPWRGETNLRYTGPQPPYDHLDVAGEYSWLKAPRWRDTPVEVGPLARVLTLYATGHAETRALVDGALADLGLGLDALYSTLGRTLARAVETKIFADAMVGWLDELEAAIDAGDTDTFDDSRWDPATWPARALGVGLMDAPRGALGHWVVIRDGAIENYQMVVPTSWNASPRDHLGQPGAYEAALVGTTLARPDAPLELLRTVHSFDPCMACAVHLVDATGRHQRDA